MEHLLLLNYFWGLGFRVEGLGFRVSDVALVATPPWNRRSEGKAQSSWRLCEVSWAVRVWSLGFRI